MKSTGIVITALIGIIFVFTAFTFPINGNHEGSPAGIPDSVWNILEQSCYDCHATEGSGMAKAKLNFDNWDSYPENKQKSKAEDICKELKSGKMPPAKYRTNNPEAVPSDAELTQVCNWVEQLVK